MDDENSASEVFVFNNSQILGREEGHSPSANLELTMSALGDDLDIKDVGKPQLTKSTCNLDIKNVGKSRLATLTRNLDSFRVGTGDKAETSRLNESATSDDDTHLSLKNSLVVVSFIVLKLTLLNVGCRILAELIVYTYVVEEELVKIPHSQVVRFC